MYVGKTVRYSLLCNVKLTLCRNNKPDKIWYYKKELKQEYVYNSMELEFIDKLYGILCLIYFRLFLLVFSQESFPHSCWMAFDVEMIIDSVTE